MQSTDARPLRWRQLVPVLVGVDIIAGYLALDVAYRFRFRTDVLPPVAPLASQVPPFMLALLLLCLAYVGLYRPRYATVGGMDEYRRVAIAATLCSVLLVVIDYVATTNALSRGFLLAGLVLTTLFVSVGRFLVRRLVQHWRGQGLALRRVLVVGANQQGAALARSLGQQMSASAIICGFLDEYRPVASTVGGYPVLGDPLSVASVAPAVGATHVLVVVSGLSWEATRHIVEYLHSEPSAEVLVAPGVHAINATPLEMVQLSSHPVLAPQLSRVVGLEALLKRLLELGLVVPVLLLSLPLQLAVYLGLRLSGRPALQRVEVLGRRGRSFRIAQFPLTGWMRRWHLTRLPSLWLVVTGRMSLIGPRPIPRAEAQAYAPHMVLLGALKPGFIGPWWLVGHGRPASAEEEIRLDLEYARLYTLWTDVRVLQRVAFDLVRRSTSPPAPSPGRPAA